MMRFSILEIAIAVPILSILACFSGAFLTIGGLVWCMEDCHTYAALEFHLESARSEAAKKLDEI